jgi:hypothetical protein
MTARTINPLFMPYLLSFYKSIFSIPISGVVELHRQVAHGKSYQELRITHSTDPVGARSLGTSLWLPYQHSPFL